MGLVISQAELLRRREEWRRNGQRVVFACGVFDLLHPGHVRLLEQARSYGDIVLVGIESRPNLPAASQSSSEPIPVTPSAERAELVSALAAVDFVVELDRSSQSVFAARLAPDVVVQGGNPASNPNPGRQDADSHSPGSKLVHIPLEPGHSTARLIERIKNLEA